MEVGRRVKKMTGHKSFVNSCCPARKGAPRVVSGSDDGTVMVRSCVIHVECVE